MVKKKLNNGKKPRATTRSYLLKKRRFNEEYAVINTCQDLECIFPIYNFIVDIESTMQNMNADSTFVNIFIFRLSYL